MNEQQALAGRIVPLLRGVNVRVVKGDVAELVRHLVAAGKPKATDAEIVEAARRLLPPHTHAEAYEAATVHRVAITGEIAPARLRLMRANGPAPFAWLASRSVEVVPGAIREVEAFLAAGEYWAVLPRDPAAAGELLRDEAAAALREFDRAATMLATWGRDTLRHLTDRCGLAPDAAAAAIVGSMDRRHRSSSPVRTLLRDLAASLDTARAELEAGHVEVASALRIQDDTGFSDFPASFPLARSMGRRHVLIVGPTNSGKTHAALDIAAAAGSAEVLSPLRLLALEHQDALASRGVLAGMVTGEEDDLPDGARHVARTIETLDTVRAVDVAVIDEVQMLAQPERGHAWTRAIVGVPARTVVMTGSEDAVPAVERLVALCGERLEVRRLARLSPLRAIPHPVRADGIGAGDALIAFTRADVLRWKGRLERDGLSVAAVYGALNPDVRRAEAARFRSGAAQVLVATDAVGLGLNLGPLRRVLFTETHKYDGVSRRSLRPAELRQIAGRAGRHGHQPFGEAGVLDDLDPRDLVQALEGPVAALRLDTFPVSPDGATVAAAADMLGTASLGRALRFLATHLAHGSPDFHVADLGRTIAKADVTDRFDLSIREKLDLARSPLDVSRRDMDALLAWSASRAAGVPAELPAAPDGAALADLEGADRLLTAYLWLSRRLPDTFDRRSEALAARDVGGERIASVLAAPPPPSAGAAR